MKVIIGVDGSERSYEAVEFASNLLDPEHDRIVLYFSTSHANAEKFERKLDSKNGMVAFADAIMAEALENLPLAFRGSVKTILGQRRPSEGLLAAAQNERVDMIVVGAHDVAKSLPFFVGGTTRSIAHQATVPVLVVRPNPTVASSTYPICIACDDSRWQHAVEAAQRLSWPDNAELSLLHVVESEDVDTVAEAKSLEPFRERLIAEHQRWVHEDEGTRSNGEATALKTQPSTTAPRVEVVRGSSVEQIIEFVRNNGTQVVVVGARRLGTLDRLLGSTTEGLLLRSPCSLLIVHEPLPV